MCKACGKPCRSETEKQLHTQRNPGHTEFVDSTAVCKPVPVDYSIKKEDPMDMNEQSSGLSEEHKAICQQGLWLEAGVLENTVCDESRTYAVDEWTSQNVCCG